MSDLVLNGWVRFGKESDFVTGLLIRLSLFNA
jgi:hypothetical protein